ncbi:hypothetical protein SAMN04488057_12019 [Cyclobacterium lianum]|uniref:FAD-dependent protein C-terminal domain-containing protein n=1 Tax=Cyclobacterium lianum TaxID=388280 RepID=A0A1M7QMG9_9BACT|nr:FAD-binding protein [Cyclobacterium lianum]SHN32268.1 hypothetical protein SAMN04488057_12019 [Cyclobacterium lianum]
MKSELNLIISPEEAYNEQLFQEIVRRKSGISKGENLVFRPIRRSLDARGKRVKVNVTVEVFSGQVPPPLAGEARRYPDVRGKEPLLIVGAGPAGMFAALRAIELGVKPIILERGKDVRSRRRDLADLNKQHLVNPDSNYCFGEGGAGTYSDGKLYTRSKKRGDIRRILEILVAHGAREDILVDAHPHIGTNKLPVLVENLRKRILESGGEILFNTRVSDFILENSSIRGLVTREGERIKGIGVVLATGHSARDIYQLLLDRRVQIAAKPFALGVRIEHDQQLIDRIQYHCKVDRGEYLPPAAYSLVQQTVLDGKQRGVFSFCMCPGGFIVPAATSPGEIVVNGMSPSRRDGKFANSGMVVAVELEDLSAYRHHGPLAAMYFQQEVEQAACRAAGNTQTAPAQRMVDFVKGRPSDQLLKTSYQPGIQGLDLHAILPGFIAKRLAMALPQMGEKMKGYYTNEAQLIGVESRTSSPVRIPRDKESFEHPQVSRLYPCGEGAGYAGGIVSAAMDGERCAEKLIAKYAGKLA